MKNIYAEHRALHKTGKRLFIGLVLGASTTLCALLFVLWLVPTLGLSQIHPWLPHITALLLGTVIVLIQSVTLWLIASAWFSRHGHVLPGSSRLWGMMSRVILPLMEGLGRLLKIPVDRVRRSFIKVNNEIVLASRITCRPDRILVLFPHCVQAGTCEYRLTYRVNNCRRCGRCPVGPMLKLRDAWGVHFAVAVGGTIARRIVVETRPKLIIAVACERDLSSGIQDTAPLPVYGIINTRPFGPCKDTQVSIKHIQSALEYFIPTEYRPRTEPSNGTTANNIQPNTNLQNEIGCSAHTRYSQTEHTESFPAK